MVSNGSTAINFSRLTGCAPGGIAEPVDLPRSVRERYIEISRALDATPHGPERSRLVKEMHELER
jgi:hypothetical protein